MKTGDIVLIPFPFSELTQVKIRPAIVVSEIKDKYKDLILAAVSSQAPSSLSSAEIINGLRASSVIKVDRIFTLKCEKVIAHIGRLSAKHIDEFSRVFKSLID